MARPVENNEHNVCLQHRNIETIVLYRTTTVLRGDLERSHTLRMAQDEMLEVEVRASGDVPVANEADQEPHDQLHLQDEGGSAEDTASTSLEREQQATHPEEDNAPTLEVVMLQKELEEIELLIRMQQKKVDVLYKMRSAVLAMESSAELNSAKNERVVVDAIIERAMETASMPELELSSKRSFENYFVERAMLPHSTKNEIADVKIMKIHSKTSDADLLVVAHRSGILAFYLAPSIELQRVDSKCADIRSIALDLHSESPSLVALCGRSEVLTYSLELVSTANEYEGHAKSTKSSTYALSVVLASRTNLYEAVQAISIVRTSRRSVVCVGKADGIIDFYAANGTLLHQMTTHASNNLIVNQRNLLAFTNGSNPVVAALVKSRDAEFQVCPGSTAHVTSLVFDPIRSDILYAGTASGDILTYAFTADAASRAAGSVRSCRLLSRTTTAQHPQKQANPSVQLAALDGYLFAATASKISVYATPRTQDGSNNALLLVCTSSNTDLHPPKELASRQILPALVTVSDGSLVTHVAITTDDNQVRVFQSILPGPSETSSSSWSSTLYVGALFAVVLLSQFFFRRSQRRAAVNSWDGMPNSVKGDADMMNALGRATGRNFDAFAENSSKHCNRYDPLSSELRDRVADARKKTMEGSFDD